VTEFLKLPISLLPVLVFLSFLVFMDSFKLVARRAVFRALLAGAAAALVSLLVHVRLLDAVHIPADIFPRYVSPITEEILKGLFVVFLIEKRRTGFIVDAAIYGFAVGAGFALVENIYYLHALQNPSIILWIVRGLGTAVMHGSTTVIFAVLSKSLHDRYPGVPGLVYLPGLLLAMGVHSLFNHFPVNPLMQTLILLILLPGLTVLVFERSEQATRTWLGVGFDSDVALLELIESGRITEDRIGTYLQSLKTRFPGQVVGDMLCLLQIHLELSVRAKGILMAREAGLSIEPDEAVKANLQELKFLEKSIGKTGKLAMLPFLNMSSRELWQLYMLGK